MQAAKAPSALTLGCVSAETDSFGFNVASPSHTLRIISASPPPTSPRLHYGPGAVARLTSVLQARNWRPVHTGKKLESSDPFHSLFGETKGGEFNNYFISALG